MQKITKETAEHYLANVPDEQCFWLKDGQSLHHLADLANALPKMQKDVFEHHVNKEKNDFSNWIKDIISDASLADKIAKAKTKTLIAKMVKDRVAELKKLAQPKK